MTTLTMRGVNKSQQGFTLIEVLLAMAITLFVGVIAYVGLSNALNAADSSAVQAKQLAELQTALTTLERDIRHASGRTVTDEYGQPQPALTGSETDPYLLQLTRIGWDNPLGQRRGEIQRVRYSWEDASLWRESWNVLDVIDEDIGLQRVLLLQGINRIELEFLTQKSTTKENGEWQALWPLADVNRGEGSGALPQAIALTLDMKNLGEVKRVVAIAAP